MEFVCSDCFEDEGLCKFIECHAESTECSFCGAMDEQPIAADIDEVARYFCMCVEKEYDDAANWLLYEKGEYHGGRNWESYELIQDQLELELPNDDSGALFKRLLDSLDDIRWCESDPYGLNPFELAKFSWDEFSRVVKHGRRYFFDDHRPSDSQLLTPARLIDTIVDFAERQELFVELTPEVPLFRARTHCTGSSCTDPQNLGPPPPEKAKQNRMSPAGIAMLYVSDEPQTALAEIDADCEEVSVGCFRVTRPALILDLTNIPPIPSLFAYTSDTIESDSREVLAFLHSVKEEISRRVSQDGLVHLKYVPTQIITEYLKCLPPIDGRVIEGIKYPSSVSQGHWSAVLFATQQNVVGVPSNSIFEDSSERWIQLEYASTWKI